MIPKRGAGWVAACYKRRGYVTGSDTLVDKLMQRVGLVNLATKLGAPPLARMSQEEWVVAPPDFLVAESATDRITDRAARCCTTRRCAASHDQPPASVEGLRRSGLRPGARSIADRIARP